MRLNFHHCSFEIQSWVMEVAVETRYQSGADQTSAAEKKYQAAKYADIIEILLSAGYFRARINGLSEFDKVSSPDTPDSLGFIALTLTMVPRIC